MICLNAAAKTVNLFQIHITTTTANRFIILDRWVKGQFVVPAEIKLSRSKLTATCEKIFHSQLLISASLQKNVFNISIFLLSHRNNAVGGKEIT